MVAIFLRVVNIGAVAIFVITARPYKEAYANILDTLILSTMALLTSFPVVYLFAFRDINSQFGRVFSYASVVILCIPYLGLLTYLLVKFYQSKWPLNWLQKKLMNFKGKYYLSSTSTSRNNQNPTDQVDGREPEESLPDRIIHPEDYTNSREC